MLAYARKTILPALCAVLALAGCSAASENDRGTNDSALIGGGVETRFAAAGYLVTRTAKGPHQGELFAGFCGVTLIAPNAVLTSASCVDPAMGAVDEIVGVGFGAVGDGKPIHHVVGGLRDWLNPVYFGATNGQGRPDLRAGIAVLQLAESVTDVTPMPIVAAPLARGSTVHLVGYGRVTEGPYTDDDSSPLDHPEMYPFTRKSVDLVVEVARGVIDAYPRPGDPRGGGICAGDFGGGLITEDGRLAGALLLFPGDVMSAFFFDQTPLCRADNGGSFANVVFGSNPAFIQQKLAEASAALASKGH
jgi:hypothetical protein